MRRRCRRQFRRVTTRGRRSAIGCRSLAAMASRAAQRVMAGRVRMRGSEALTAAAAAAAAFVPRRRTVDGRREAQE